MSGHVVTFVRMSDDRLSGASTDQISTTVATVLSEYFKSSERTIFWNDDLKRNIDPFEGREGGFFTADWDFKVCDVGRSVVLDAQPVFLHISSKSCAS
jgi:hypothetical protein